MMMWIPRKVLSSNEILAADVLSRRRLGVPINSQPLGRIVAGDKSKTLFISFAQQVADAIIHSAFRSRLQMKLLHRWLRRQAAAGLGADGPGGPRTGSSSGTLPGNSSGRGDSPGSRTGDGMSGCGLPGGASGGGSVG
jgi:hypothetical protein